MTPEEVAAIQEKAKLAREAAAAGAPPASTPVAGAASEEQHEEPAAPPVEDETPVVIAGDPIAGGPFTIAGPGFGSSGTLTIGNQSFAFGQLGASITRWDDRSIRGEMPPKTKGAIVLTIEGRIIRRGVFPAKK